ncbi:hypothetical protein BFJ66_g15726 [Fusarium oxysporum f. sp. cepae]|uniref:Uncharacterized protein n=1 Tax=Fusarium oxysporum f. sp. cepae TaxID=396571 RepID=A0A3L6N1F6_FUSOX|nr:hypothetical protein H9L39_19828 [Fusarium oxysporum f. sp. albedinis]RKK11088.1 hypothetical protein BFJ65_g15080 [Fusarium oxysporum f. sp. cepae]RKK30461.1 hypothetical protein BFJ67_g15737 [Fusarium oxysporum f. sp. cepae]RKK31697.1 hypothetical protein BFJ66_g15726 [Fusarium oxysporum f. sp. cepae]
MVPFTAKQIQEQLKAKIKEATSAPPNTSKPITRTIEEPRGLLKASIVEAVKVSPNASKPATTIPPTSKEIQSQFKAKIAEA